MKKFFALNFVLILVALFVVPKSPSNSIEEFSDLFSFASCGQFYNFRTHAIFYRDTQESDKPALLLLHGFPSGSYDWMKLWPSLNQEFRLIAADYLGFGLSDKPVGYNYTISNQADIIEFLLADLHVDKVHILAHDYGDTVAQELLARQSDTHRNHSTSILSIAFLNGGLFSEVHRPVMMQKLLRNEVLGPILTSVQTKQSFTQTFSKIFGAMTQLSHYEMDMYWFMYTYKDGHRVVPKILHYMDERVQFRERWVGALQHTHIPMCFINGPSDPISGRHMADRYREVVPNPDVTYLPDHIAHYPQVESPDLVLEAFRTFHAKSVPVPEHH